MNTNSIDRNSIVPLPVACGLVSTSVWSLVLCVYSALGYPIGSAAGLEFNIWIIGSISRYWDPLFLGLLVFFLVWSVESVKNVKDFFLLNLVVLLIGAFFFSTIVKMVLTVCDNNQFFWILFIVVILNLVSIKWKDTIIFFVFLNLLFWYELGILIALLFSICAFVCRCVVRGFDE